MSDERSWVKIVGDYVDIITKVGIGIGAALIGIYLTWDKQKFDEAFQINSKQFEQDAKCAETKKSIFEFSYGKVLEGDMVSALVNYWVPPKCTGPSQADRDQLVSVLIKVANSGRKTEAPQATLPETTPQATAPTSKKGWVAVGFANSSDFNFVDKNGKNLTAAPLKGATIQTKWPVNIRPQAADWKTSVGILNQGWCFVVEDIISLPAAGQFQIWASGHTAPCDKAS